MGGAGRGRGRSELLPMKARSGVEHQFSAGIAEIRNAAESGNGFMAQVMKQFQAPLLWERSSMSPMVFPQTTNLGVGGSNPSGRAISLFRFNTRALSQCACAHSVLCVPKIRFCNIGGEGHRELVVI